MLRRSNRLYQTTYEPVRCQVCRAHSPTFPALHLNHNSFFNPSVALPTSQLILQPFHCFTYITVHSPTLLLLLLRHHKFFTYVTWRAAHGSFQSLGMQCFNYDIIRHRLSVPRPERITIREKFCHGSGLVLDSSVVRAPAHKAGEPGSSPGPGKNFFLLLYFNFN